MTPDYSWTMKKYPFFNVFTVSRYVPHTSYLLWQTVFHTSRPSKLNEPAHGLHSTYKMPSDLPHWSQGVPECADPFRSVLSTLLRVVYFPSLSI